jgi:hypothetical protein
MADVTSQLLCFLGAELLVEQHKALPMDSQYVRCAEIHDIEHGKKFELIICMSRAMSQHLLTAAHLSIDTSFKRVHGRWQEFEMESWDAQSKKCKYFRSHPKNPS